MSVKSQRSANARKRYDEGWFGRLYYQVAKRTVDLALRARFRADPRGRVRTDHVLGQFAARAPQAEVAPLVP